MGKFVLKNFSLNTIDARKWYLENEKTIPILINKNLSTKEQVKQAFQIRNKICAKARDLMSDRKEAKRLDITDLHLTWEELIKKVKDKGYEGDDIYRCIVESSQRSRSSVNKYLGLE